MKHKSWVFLFPVFLVLSSSFASAQNTAERKIKKAVQQSEFKKKRVKKDVRPPVEQRSKTQDTLAIPVGGLVGFGLGHSMQNRYDSGGLLYTIIDGVTLAAIPLFVMGDCAPNDSACEDDQDRNSAILMVAFWGSRIVQAIDLSLFYSRQTYAPNQAATKNNNAQLYLMPSTNGSLHANLAWSF